MRLALHCQNLSLDDEQRQHVERRVGFAFARLSTQARNVEVHFRDLNGPRGGIDKRCRVVVHLERGPAVIVEDIDSDLPDLIDRAVARAARAAHKRVALGTLKRRLLPWPSRRRWMLDAGTV